MNKDGLHQGGEAMDKDKEREATEELYSIRKLLKKVANFHVINPVFGYKDS